MLNKEITLNYLLQIVRRHKLAVIIPATLITAAAAVFAMTLPSIYLSDTVILVEPQQAIQTMAGKPYLGASIERDSLATLSQQILSRSNLEQIINKYDLYNPLPIEQRVRNLREDIQLDVVRPDQTGNVSGFKISYQYKEPRTTAEVTTLLADLFIKDNASSRSQILSERLRFLEEQTTQAKAKLDDQSQHLQLLKQKNFDRLPEQREQNLKMIEQLNTQLATNTEALNRSQQQRVYLESMLYQYQAAPKRLPIVPSITEPLPGEPPTIELPPGVNAFTATSAQLEAQRGQLAELQNKYTDKHPDVIRASRRVAELEQVYKVDVEKEVLNSAKRVAAAQHALELNQQRVKASNLANSTHTPESNVLANSETLTPETFATLAQVTSQLRSIKPEIQSRTAEQNRLISQQSLYRGHLELPAAVEEELVSLTNGYNAAKESYQTISNERDAAQMAEDLEHKQKTMLFRILDPAKQPEKPYKPNRRMIVLYGLLAGLGAGFGLAFYREFNDQSLHTEQDVETALGLPVLATIPQV